MTTIAVPRCNASSRPNRPLSHPTRPCLSPSCTTCVATGDHGVGLIVLDTTVLVYAVGAEHELREPCRRLLSAPKSIGLTTTAGVIQEFVHVRSRRRPRADAVGLGWSYLTLLRPLLQVPDEAVEQALGMLGGDGALGAFDAILAAAALSGGCRAVVTADRAFAVLDDLRVVFPDESGVTSLLGQ